MRPIALALLALASCLDFSIGQKTADAGATSSADASTSRVDAAASDSGAAGINCGADPQTGETLCLGLSACPGLTVDQGAFPGCGFRVTGGSTIDLECSCSGYLCPIGVASSCAQAQGLLGSQSYTGVCIQVSEGRCTSGTAKPPSSNCDKTCASQCGGDPTCLSGCGC